jgi:hypothetical protein
MNRLRRCLKTRLPVGETDYLRFHGAIAWTHGPQPRTPGDGRPTGDRAR